MLIFKFMKAILWNVNPFFSCNFYEGVDLPALIFDGFISGSYFSKFLVDYF
jgi:hypothetical protein